MPPATCRNQACNLMEEPKPYYPATSHATLVVLKKGLWDGTLPAPGSRSLDKARIHIRDPTNHPRWSTEAHEQWSTEAAGLDTMPACDAETDARRTASLFLGVLAVESIKDNPDKAWFAANTR